MIDLLRALEQKWREEQRKGEEQAARHQKRTGEIVCAADFTEAGTYADELSAILRDHEGEARKAEKPKSRKGENKMITARQLRYFTLYTLILCGVPLALLLSGCATSPNIDPGRYLRQGSDAQHFVLDDKYWSDSKARTELQHKERWAAFWCDVVSTGIAIGTGGGSELWGNATLLAKIPVSYVVEKKLVRDAENGHPAGMNIVNTFHWGACLWNAAVIL
jgi:hypothetical protein